jgi:hypothetical protein
MSSTGKRLIAPALLFVAVLPFLASARSPEKAQLPESYSPLSEDFVSYHYYLLGVLSDNGTKFHALQNRNLLSDVTMFTIPLSQTDGTLTKSDLDSVSHSTAEDSLFQSVLTIEAGTSDYTVRFLSTMAYLQASAEPSAGSTSTTLAIAKNAQNQRTITLTGTYTLGYDPDTGKIGVNNPSGNPNGASYWSTSVVDTMVLYDISEYAIPLYHSQSGKELGMRIYHDMAGATAMTDTIASQYFASWKRLYSDSGVSSVGSFLQASLDDTDIHSFLKNSYTYFEAAGTSQKDAAPFVPLAPSASFMADREALLLSCASGTYDYYRDSDTATVTSLVSADESGYLVITEPLLLSAKTISIRYDYSGDTSIPAADQYSDYVTVALPTLKSAPADAVPIDYVTDTEIHFTADGKYQFGYYPTTSLKLLSFGEYAVTGLTAESQVKVTYRLAPNADGVGTFLGPEATVKLLSAANKDTMKTLYDWYSGDTTAYDADRTDFYQKIHDQSLGLIPSDQEYLNYLAEPAACLAWRDTLDKDIVSIKDYLTPSDSSFTEKQTGEYLSLMRGLSYKIEDSTTHITYAAADLATLVSKAKAIADYNRIVETDLRNYTLLFQTLIQEHGATEEQYSLFDSYFAKLRNAADQATLDSLYDEATKALNGSYGL